MIKKYMIAKEEEGIEVFLSNDMRWEPIEGVQLFSWNKLKQYFGVYTSEYVYECEFNDDGAIKSYWKVDYGIGLT